MHKIIKYRTPVLTGKGRIFSYMMFFYAFAVALLSPVFPEYVLELSGAEYYVGMVIAVGSFVTLLVSLCISKIMHKMSRLFLLYSGFFIMAIVFLQFFFADSFGSVLVAQIIKGAAVAVLFVVIPLMVRDYTARKSLAHEEGIYYWFINLAWVVGPLAGGVIAYYFGIDFTFLVSMMIVLAAVLFLQHEHVVEIASNEDEERSSSLVCVKEFFCNKYLRRAYLVDLGLFIWWSIATVCIPLYLASEGFPEFAIGIVLAIKLMPLLIFEKWVGNHTKDCDLGSNIRKGFLLIVMAVIAGALIYHVYFSIFMLLIASVGAAFIEPVKETYLFKNLKRSRENDLFPVYSTARQVGYLIGPALGGFIITFLGYQTLFFIVGFGLLPMVFIGHLISKE